MSSIIGSAVRVINDQGKFCFHGVVADLIQPTSAVFEHSPRYLVLVEKTKKLKLVAYSELRVDIHSLHGLPATAESSREQLIAWNAKVADRYGLKTDTEPETPND
jgi:hypothetical protein